MGFKSEFWEDNSKTSILDWFSHSFTNFDVWEQCPVRTPNCIQEPIFLLMILGFPEEFGENAPPSLFHLLSLQQQNHWQQNSSVLGVKCINFSPPNILLLIVAEQHNSWALRCCACSKDFLAQQPLKPWSTHARLWWWTTVFQQLLIYFRLASDVEFLSCWNQYCALSDQCWAPQTFPLSCCHVKSNGPIKQALLKWVLKSHQLLSSVITQNKLRGHATKKIWFT